MLVFYGDDGERRDGVKEDDAGITVGKIAVVLEIERIM